MQAWRFRDGEWSEAPPEQPAAAPPSLQVVSYNLWFDAFERERRLDGLQRLLAELRPEVIAVQEATLRVLQPLLAAGWLQKDYWCSASHTSTAASHGVVVFSRLPVAPLSLMQLPGVMGRRLLVADFGFLRLGVVHLESSAGNGPIRVEQLQIACATLREARDSLLVGDCNFSDKDPEYAEIPADFVDLWPRLHPGDPGYTLDTERNPMLRKQIRKELQLRIDRMLLRSSSWVPQSIGLLGDEPLAPELFCSDHFGLLASFKST